MLIGPRGDIAWMCAPRWDSDAVFSSLIGGAGTYGVTPIDEPFIWGGEYEPATLIWRSRWTTTSQTIECCDALAFPGDPRTAIVLRRIEATDGDAWLRIVFDPRAGFGRYGMRDLKLVGDSWTARTGGLYLRWSGATTAERRADGALELTIRVEAGQHHDLVLEISDRRLQGPVREAEELWAQTRTEWSAVVSPLSGTLADRDATHSVAVLTGMTSSGGGMVAGATMSLPERFERNRNYDYRYAWIRDQCYAGQAAALTRQFGLLDDAVKFVSDRLISDGASLKPAYTVEGGAVPDERSLKLPGYPGGSDKVGNWVNHQFQLDAFGEALLLFASAARHDRISGENWRAVTVAVGAIATRWRDPDAGIWEIDNQHWTHSRLSCIAGLRGIARHAPAAQAAQWVALADEILAAIGTTSIHSSGRWQRSPGDDRIDSALLIPAVRGALAPGDPRTIATLDAALRDLADDGYMYRFRQDEAPLGSTEGAFLLCGFMTSLALHQQGREVEANRWFERNRAACGTPGLFAEEFSVAQRQLRGNLPQAFVHALLLETAQQLATPIESVAGSPNAIS